MFSNSIGSSIRPASRQILSTYPRAFSTTPAALSNQIPPESPSYIRLPKPPQSEEHQYERVRGYIPVPRDLFPRDEGKVKTSKDYLKRTAPQPSDGKRAARSKSRAAEWKGQLADARRENLDSGLQALWERRRTDQEARRARSKRKHEANKAAMLAPEREDDRITRGTVLDAILDTKVYPDPQRFERAEQSRQRIQEIESAKQEERRDALMELYINASGFITQESELKAEIEKVFAEDYFRKQSHAASRYGTTENIWGVQGKPQDTTTMLRAARGGATKVIDYFETEYDRSVKRQKRIAEEFTGGKME